jgi:hypothetical protein
MYILGHTGFIPANRSLANRFEMNILCVQLQGEQIQSTGQILHAAGYGQGHAELPGAAFLLSSFLFLFFLNILMTSMINSYGMCIPFSTFTVRRGAKSVYGLLYT